MKLNYFLLSVAVLQFCAAGSYTVSGAHSKAILLFLYGLTNLIIMVM